MKFKTLYESLNERNLVGIDKLDEELQKFIKKYTLLNKNDILEISDNGSEWVVYYKRFSITDYGMGKTKRILSIESIHNKSEIVVTYKKKV